MSFKLYLVVILVLPTIALTDKCPDFESVIPLREGVTAHNWTYAVIANGKYHLLTNKDKKTNDQIGPMPTGFETDTLTTVIDRSDCADPQYYLIAVKSFATNQIQTNYTSLDLINWSATSRWSEPKPIANYSMLSKDPTLMQMINFNLIQDKVKTLFYWNLYKSFFLVSEPFSTGTYNYRIIQSQDICNDSFRYFPETPNQFYSLNETLGGSVVSPLDLCYIKTTENYSALKCFSNLTFQAYLIQNDNNDGFIGPLKTMPLTKNTDETKMAVSRLRDIGRLCRSPIVPNVLEDLIDKESIANENDYVDDDLETKPKDGKSGWVIVPKVADQLKPKAESEPKESDDVSYTVIIIVVCVLLMVLLVAAIGVTATRRNNQLARM